MRETQWLEWPRAMLQQGERDDLLATLTVEQESHLLGHDSVWVEKAGVLWKTADGAVRGSRTGLTFARSVESSTSTPRAACLSSRIPYPTHRL